MFIMTMTKRKVLRAALFFLVLVTGVAIGVFAILSSISTQAAQPKLPIYCVDRTDNKISITFDCAWEGSDTDEIIAILKEADIKATFFVTGEFCDKYAADVKKFFDAGHEIANHSDKHPHVKGMNINDLLADTKECSRKIKMITGSEPVLYRCPYGEYDDAVITTVTGIGFKCIQWNVDSIDWDNASVEQITDRTTKNVASGSILLFHNDTENTVKALPAVLKSLKEQGFEPVKVSELIYSDRYTIDGTGKQIKLKETVSQIKFSDDETIDSAFRVLASVFTEEDILNIEQNGMNGELAEKAKQVLTEEQAAAIRELSFDELYELFEKLRTAVLAEDDETVSTPDDTDVTSDGGVSDPVESDALDPAPTKSTDGEVIADSRPETTTAKAPETTYVLDKDGGMISVTLPPASVLSPAEAMPDSDTRPGGSVIQTVQTTAPVTTAAVTTTTKTANSPMPIQIK